MVPVIDSHCHLDMIEERGIPRDEIKQQLRDNQITAVAHIAADLSGVKYIENFEKEEWPCAIFYTLGRHPGEAHENDGYDGLAEIANHAKDKNFKAIGEIGLDYYYHKDTREIQIKTFEKYLEAALEYQKPVCIHTREAYDDTYQILKQVSDKIPVLIHCFTGNKEEMYGFLDLGFYISFSGIVTFKNADNVREAAIACPVNQMIVETDAPFLAPVPKRGKTNQPAYVRHTLDFLAEKRNENIESFAQTIYNNTVKFYGLEGL
ncbi:MAG: TatD family deoxyribonuclease [Candidatus Hydrogenedentota bacterium]|nr:MAG: TatD family deoxyribonuclease [Candidatus Hydrogenedentota bacterium]